MASFAYRYAITECSSCGALYTRNCGCSKGSLEDKILVPCALIRKTLEEVFQDFQDTSESSDDDTNFTISSVNNVLDARIEPAAGQSYYGCGGGYFPTREPRVHVPNVLPTHPTLDTDFILLSEPLFAYIVWIFLPFLTYPVVPPYLLSTGNEDTIFDPGISIFFFYADVFIGVELS
ncbi:hypothetical protein Tco_1226407 [Tanacetum coccineum]